jgi:hypothetical protein
MKPRIGQKTVLNAAETSPGRASQTTRSPIRGKNAAINASKQGIKQLLIEE